MRVNTKIAEEFFELQKELPTILKAYGLSGNFVAKKTGIPQSSFSRKMKKKEFSADEMLRICAAINN
ncbi:MAG: hypothetical protein KTR26_16475 [Flammeovirgaceae bacterium]|nr:hypothetical protein [Flammeovirgaceae bacterium]